MSMLRSLNHNRKSATRMYIPRFFSTDKAKVVRELTQHVREMTSEVSEKDIGESTRRRKLKLS